MRQGEVASVAAAAAAAAAASRTASPPALPLPSPLQALIAVDIAVSFRVARYKDGQLVTDKRQLAIDYLKGYFVVDVLSGGCLACIIRFNSAAAARTRVHHMLLEFVHMGLRVELGLLAW